VSHGFGWKAHCATRRQASTVNFLGLFIGAWRKEQALAVEFGEQ
jgi:hypothetical protein